MYSANPEIDAACHEEYLDHLAALDTTQEELEEATRDLTEAVLQAMREGSSTKVRGTFAGAKSGPTAISASEAIYEVCQLADGGAVIDAAICYLAKSTDPVARAHADKIAMLFADSRIGA